MADFIIKYWLQFLFGVSVTAITSACIWLYNRFRSISESNLALLHNELYQLCPKYLEEKKWASAEDKRNLEYLFKPYKKLGGNGTCETMYNQCMALPIYPPGEVTNV